MQDNPMSTDSRPLIIVVEDDLDLVEVLTDELGEEFRVISAFNGREGLKKALECLPDLIISDIMMPVLDGIALCRELKNNPETAEIPLILLTARSSVENQLEGLKTGADDYILKPFVMDLLEARIRNLIQSRRILRERYEPRALKLDVAPSATVGDQRLLPRVLDVVEGHCAEPGFDSDELAAALSMSLRTLQRKLKATANHSPASLIREFRMSRSANLLMSSSLSVTEIGHSVGFMDSSHFARLFKEQYEVSPSVYRSTYRQ
jgi:DNA-binding response OmpR family regulator